MQVLVAGNKEVDAGKTTFTRGLRAAIEGYAVKPRAANSRWYHQDTYREALIAGALYGKDAKRLAADQPDVAVTDVNPIHRLWQPATEGESGLVGPADQEFVCDRVGDRYVVNTTATMPDGLIEALPLDDAVTVETLGELNRAMYDLHLPVLEAFEADLEGITPLLVESYGDIALPTRTLGYDLVAVVEPERVRYYPGDQFVRTAEAVSSSPREGRMEPVVPDVLRELEPIADRTLPPLTAADRGSADAIARAYGDAFAPVRTAVEA